MKFRGIKLAGLLVIAISLCVFSNASAQYGYDREFGVKIGYNSASISGNWGQLENYKKAKSGISIGAFFGRKLSDMGCWRGEILYTQKGIQFTATDEYGNQATAGYKLSYIEVTGGYSITPGSGNVKPFITFGSVVSYLASAQLFGPGGEIDAKELLLEYDLGILIGAGIEIPSGQGKVILEGRYTLGLLDVDKSATESHSNGVLTLSAGYSFL
jgi:hypothetical protein